MTWKPEYEKRRKRSHELLKTVYYDQLEDLDTEEEKDEQEGLE